MVRTRNQAKNERNDDFKVAMLSKIELRILLLELHFLRNQMVHWWQFLDAFFSSFKKLISYESSVFSSPLTSHTSTLSAMEL